VFILAWSLLGGIMYMGHIWVVEYLCLLSWFNHKKKKKLSFFSQQPLSTLTELGSCTLYNIFCPFQGIIENNFCLSSGLIFCLEISRRVVTLLCLFVQVYETCTSTFVLTRVVWLYHVPVQGIVRNSVLKLVAS
jgi:hypothetical protein